MHELGIVSEVVDIASERAAGARVTRLVLAIGALSSVMPDAVRFCFDVAAEGTPLEGADLVIREVVGRGTCRVCGEELLLPRPVVRCACGAFDVAWSSGTEVRIIEMEVA